MIFNNFFGTDILTIVLLAMLIDHLTGELPIRHPVVIMGDFIKFYEKIAYKNSIFMGLVLVIILLSIVGVSSYAFQSLLINISKNTIEIKILCYLILAAVASTGLASKTLKNFINDVLVTNTLEEAQEKLSGLVTRNTKVLDERKVYSSLIETYSENLSDGVIGPLLYLLLFGLPGIMVYKAISTMDSMIGYKNERYEKFGKVAAKLDDILNYMPARITAVLIWLLGKEKTTPEVIKKDAVRYSTSPNAGFPVAAAAHTLGVILGGTIYYGNQRVDKAEIGTAKVSDYREAAFDFFKIHQKIDAVLLGIIFSFFILNFFCNL